MVKAQRNEHTEEFEYFRTLLEPVKNSFVGIFYLYARVVNTNIFLYFFLFNFMMYISCKYICL